MTKEKRFVYLSAKNLAACWAWTEANPGHPLAEAYETSCGGVATEMDVWGIAECLPKKNGERLFVVLDRVRAIQDLSYQHRDSIGRMILLLARDSKEDGNG